MDTAYYVVQAVTHNGKFYDYYTAKSFMDALSYANKLYDTIHYFGGGYINVYEAYYNTKAVQIVHIINC